MSTQTVFCHLCQRQSVVTSQSWSGRCLHCDSDFTEVVDGSRASNMQRTGRARRTSGRGGGPRGSGRPQLREIRGPIMSQGERGHPVLQLLSGLMGDYMGNGRMIFDMMDGSADQELLDMIASRLMDEYQPSSTPTATRIREHLPMYNVRPRMAKEEPTQVEACACAGEPCTICHDEFVEGNRVAELPCSHCFHGDCIKPWLETNNTCPVCRIELPKENP